MNEVLWDVDKRKTIKHNHKKWVTGQYCKHSQAEVMKIPDDRLGQTSLGTWSLPEFQKIQWEKARIFLTPSTWRFRDSHFITCEQNSESTLHIAGFTHSHKDSDRNAAWLAPKQDINPGPMFMFSNFYIPTIYVSGRNWLGVVLNSSQYVCRNQIHHFQVWPVSDSVCYLFPHLLARS